MKQNKYKIIEPFLKKEKKLKELSSEHEIPYSTLKRWIKSYKELGVKGLSKKVRSDKDSFRKVDNKTIKFILKEYKINPNINITTLYKNYLSIFKNSNNKLSYNTIYRITSNLDPFSQKHVKQNIKNIKQTNSIYRISTEKLYIKNLNINNEVATIIIIYDVYDDSILNYKISTEKVTEENYLALIKETIEVNKIGDYLVIPKNIFIDDFNIKNKEKFATILKKLDININGNSEKNKEISKFVRFLEKDIINIFGGRDLTIDYLNKNLNKYICNNILKESLVENKLFIFNKLDYLLESTERKVQNCGIRFKNNLYSDEILKGYVGEVLTLRYNPLDLKILKIYLKDNYLFSIDQTQTFN